MRGKCLRAIDTLIREGHPLATGLKLELLCPAEAVKASPFTEIPLRLLPSAPGHVWEQFILPGYVTGGLLSLCNTGPIAVKKQIVCIHDVNTRIAPESYSSMFRAAYRFIQPALGRRAAQIVTVSRYSQNALAGFGIRSADDTKVIHNGHEHVLRWNADHSALDEAELPLPFVLFVGSSAPHKNVAIVYSIADELAARGINILIAGGEDKKVYAREQHRPPPNIRHLGRVDDNHLAFLYRRALCLLFPSRTEGFGLPVLEAMALGCPVISSDAASLPEVCGEAALYAPPDDASAWLTAIRRIINEPTLSRRLASCGVKRSTAFSWRQSAEKYLELMFAVDHGNRERAAGKIADALQA